MSERMLEIKLVAPNIKSLAEMALDLYNDLKPMLGQGGAHVTEPAKAETPVNEVPWVKEAEEAPVVEAESVTKEMLKAILYKVRDERGSNRVAYLYQQYGNGATSLKTLKEEDYAAMYRACKEAVDAAD